MSEEKHITREEFAARANAILTGGDLPAWTPKTSEPGPAECFDWLDLLEYDVWYDGVWRCGDKNEYPRQEDVQGTGDTPLAAVQAAWRANQ